MPCVFCNASTAKGVRNHAECRDEWMRRETEGCAPSAVHNTVRVTSIRRTAVIRRGVRSFCRDAHTVAENCRQNFRRSMMCTSSVTQNGNAVTNPAYVLCVARRWPLRAGLVMDCAPNAAPHTAPRRRCRTIRRTAATRGEHDMWWCRELTGQCTMCGDMLAEGGNRECSACSNEKPHPNFRGYGAS